MKIILSTVVLLSSFIAQAATDNKAIYGVDSRIDVNDTKDSKVIELASSVAAMVSTFAFRPNFYDHRTNDIQRVLRGESLAASVGLCSSERFLNQPTTANCTGFLISPTLLATAGHCVSTTYDCSDNKWVFDYKLKSGKDNSVGAIDPSNIYSCNQIVSQKLGIFTRSDWAVIELDRPVTGRKPLTLSSSKPSKGDALFVIGTPSGLPLKYATGKARSRHFKYFKTNLDTFSGNSGSPVFNKKTGEVQGILVRGETDYKKGFCNTATVFPENGGRGEDVSYVNEVIEILERY